MKLGITLCYIVSLFIIFLSSNTCVGSAYDNSCQSRNFLIISTIDGVVTALDADTGKKCWSVVLNAEKFLSSSLSQVEIYENDRRIWLVPSLDGGIYKYDNFRKEIQPLPFNVDSLINQPFFFDPSTSVIGGKVKLLYGINSLTGEIIYVCKKDGCTSFVSSFPETVLLFEEMIQFANAIDSSKAEQKWHFRVSEVTVKLASQAPNVNSFAFKNGSQKNALIPRNYQDFVNVDISTYKISLQNGFAGMLNKTTQTFSWSFKASCPITDVWFVKDTMVKLIDPFNSESGFFSVNIDDGQHLTLLFLGSFENQLFIKKSKNFPVKETAFNSVSTIVFYESYIIPVCSKSENNVAHSSLFRREDLSPSLSFNVTEYGTYFYINYTVVENKTHCVINTSYTVKYEKTFNLSYQIFAIYLVTCTMTCIVFLIIFPRFIQNKINKEHANLKMAFGLQLTTADTEFRSRFHQDFEYLSTLGRGGFGVVMDVKNKIDDCRYAVKRIRLHEQLNKTQYGRVLREVKALAKLDHHGIVRYFNAWTEYPPMGWQEEKDKQYKISGCNESETAVNSSSLSIIESSREQIAPSKRKKTHSLSEYISKSKKQKVSKFDIKINQNPLAVFEEDLLNIDSQLSETTLSENQDRNSDLFFDSHTGASESEQSTSNEDSYEETSHDSQFRHDREESNDSFSVVFEASNKSMSREDNILAEYTDSKSSHESVPNKIACKEDSSLFLKEDGEESNDSFSVVFERSNNSKSHKDNILAKCTDPKSSHESIPNKIDCKEDTSLKVKCLHHKCQSVLKSLNEKVIYKLNPENFDALCIYFFHDESSSGISVTERLDWKKIVHENVLIDKTSFQRWLLCILCLIRSSGDFVCPLLVINLCYILSDVSKHLSSMKNGFKLPGRELHRRPTVHFLNRKSKQSDSTKKSTFMFPFSHKSKASTKSSKDIPSGYLYIQMQLCRRDSLRDWLDVNNNHRDYDEVMDIFSQIVEAVHYVHNCGLMHRDLKPSNIYFSLEGAIKIGDFGLATSSEIHDANVNNAIKSFTHTSDIGTEIYMSPEQKKKQDYGYKTDIYSLGIILFELLVPFKTRAERFKVVLQVREHKFPENFTVEYTKESELLSNLLNDNPANRPTTDEIKRKLMLIKLPSAVTEYE